MTYRKVNDTSLASVADAIREKGGTSDALVFPDGFISAIQAVGDVAPFTSVICGTFVTQYAKTLTIDGLSNCKIFAMRSVED